jgi:hypothetical protein
MRNVDPMEIFQIQWYTKRKMPAKQTINFGQIKISVRRTINKKIRIQHRRIP